MRSNGVSLIALNSGESDVWVDLWFTEMQNLFAPEARRWKRIPPHGRVVMTRGFPREAGRPIDYRYRWFWSPADPDAVPATEGWSSSSRKGAVAAEWNNCRFSSTTERPADA